MNFEIHLNRKKEEACIVLRKEGKSLLNCAKCGKEILDKESSFCAYCGIPFDSKPKSSDLATGAGILAIIAATFSGALGTIGIVNYQSYIAYYTSYGYDTSGSIGFLLFGVFALVSSIFGVAGGMLALTRKRFKFSVLGILLVLASAVFTFIAVWQYQYGYTEVMLLSEISMGVFSVASAVFVVKSKTEFTESARESAVDSTE